MHRKSIDCKCRREFTQDQFARLREPNNGCMQEDGAGGWLELRVCFGCGSTIAREVSAIITGPMPMSKIPESPRA